MVSVALYLLLSVISLASADPTGSRCPIIPTRTDTCSCFSPRGVIDLTSISNSDGTPRFNASYLGGSNYIFYNPCKTFDLGDCKADYACEGSRFGYFDIANGTEEMWIDTDGTPYVFYSEPGPIRTEFKVYLYCDPLVTTPVFTTAGNVKNIFRYESYISSCQVCPGGCSSPNPAPYPSLPIPCPPIRGEPSCVCQLSDDPNSIIDLKPYANVNGTARFSVEDVHGNTYYYNPCQSFHYGNCWNTHICVENYNATFLAIANFGTEKMFIGSDYGEAYIQYNGPNEVLSRVYLECDPLLGRDQSAKMVVGARTTQSDTCPLISVLTIKSNKWCPRGRH